MAGADLALEDPAGIGARTHGTGVPVDGAGTVGLLQAAGAVALDDAGVAVALADAGDVHMVAHREGVGLDHVAHVHLSGLLQLELLQMLLGGHAGLGQVALLRLGQLALGDVLKAQLHSLVTVLLGGLLLHHDTGAGLDHSDRDHLAVGVENLAHADFLTDDSFLHW